MPGTTGSLTVRRVAPDEVPLLLGWDGSEPVARVDDARLEAEMASRCYRPEWSWVAEVDGAQQAAPSAG